MSPGTRPAIIVNTGGDGGERTAPALARLLQLDVWGSSQLNSRAAYEMGGAAGLLTIVFLFELTAWSTLFNIIVQGGAWSLGWSTLLAILIGLIFATMVFIFERGIITTDVTARRGLFSAAVLVRLILIGASALATAQPVELLVFQQEINERLRDEAVRAEALRQLEQLNQETPKAGDSDLAQATREIKGTDLYRRLSEAEAKVTAAEKVEPNPELAIQTSRRERLTTAIANLKARRNQDDGNAATRETEIEQYQQTLRRLSAILAPLEAADVRRGEAVTTAKKERDQLASEVDGAIKARAKAIADESASTGKRAQARRDWLRQVQSAPVGATLPGNEVYSGVWNPYVAGFVHRQQVLSDLREARLPNWPPSERGVREKAVALFGIGDMTLSDGIVLERLKERAANFRFIYLIAFVVALMVPMLTLAFKLIMGRELRLYYSTSAQAQNGNYAAQAVLSAEKGVVDHRRAATGA